MCTVIGYQGNKDAKDILIQALQRTKSRGPDDQRIESFDRACLVFNDWQSWDSLMKGCSHFS